MGSTGKHIERLVRRTFLSVLRLIPGRGGNAQDLSSLVSPRILLIRPDRIGDAIISVPVIQMLRERFPGAVIDMLLGEKNRSAAALLPGLDATLVIPAAPLKIPGMLRQIRARHYDIVINLLAKDSASGAVLTSLAGGRFRIGFQGSHANIYDIAVPAPARPMHMVRTTSLLLQPLGINPIGDMPSRPAERLTVVIPLETRERMKGTIKALLHELPSPIVALNISGSGTEKFFGVESYVEVARLLRAAGITSVFGAAPGDAAFLEAIATGSGCPALPITRSLAEFAALLEHADLIVTPDTSIVHIAAALGKPTVVMVTSSENGLAWRPWGVPHAVVTGNGTVTSIGPDQLAVSIISLVSATVGIFPTSSAS